jgi:hypothetical protein
MQAHMFLKAKQSIGFFRILIELEATKQLR